MQFPIKKIIIFIKDEIPSRKLNQHPPGGHRRWICFCKSTSSMDLETTWCEGTTPPSVKKCIFIVKLAKHKPPPTLQNELLVRENETLLIRACAATVK